MHQIPPQGSRVGVSTISGGHRVHLRPQQETAMKSSRTATADATFLSAEGRRRRQLARNLEEGLRFPSARAALAWYYEKRLLLSSPQGMHPRTETAPNGQQVSVSVDGGRGGDFDEVLATVATIGKALAELEAFDKRGHQLVELCIGKGWTQTKVARELGYSQGSVSKRLGRAQDVVWAQLQDTRSSD